LAADPICAAAHNNLGNVLLRLGRVDQAVLHYRAAVDIDPADPEYRHNLGVGLRELGKSEESRSSKPALH
jgi:Flp pilus assembly protein TadD